MKVINRVKLVIPLVIVSILLIVLNNYNDFDGLTLNLATEIIGIVVTIIYVDIMIQRHNSKKWELVNRELMNHMFRLSNVFISSLRSSFGISHEEYLDLFSIMDGEMDEEERVSKSVMNKYIDNIQPYQLDYLLKMNKKDWKNLIENWTNAHNSIINHQNMYNSISDANQIEISMTLMGMSFKVIGWYRTFYDVLPVEIEQSEEGLVTRDELIKMIDTDITKLVNYLNTTLHITM